MIQHPLGGVADQQAFQALACERSHHDYGAAGLGSGLLDRIRRVTRDEITTRGRDSYGPDQPLDLLCRDPR